MADQLDLDILPPPTKVRAAALRSFHTRHQPMPVDEALEGESRAKRQDALVLSVFYRGERLTPSEVQDRLEFRLGAGAPLLTSTRRSLTNMTRAGRLEHHARERRPGPRGARESTWSLA